MRDLERGGCLDGMPCSLGVHPVPFENIPGRLLVVVLGSELQQHQTTATTISISFTVSVLLAGWNTYLTGPGDPQIGLNLITVVLMDGV